MLVPVYQVYQEYQEDQDQISGATYISDDVFGRQLILSHLHPEQKRILWGIHIYCFTKILWQTDSILSSSQKTKVGSLASDQKVYPFSVDTLVHVWGPNKVFSL